MHRVIPFGDRILVKRRKIGDKIGSGILYATEETKERKTDLADVVYVPELTFADKKILEKSEEIIKKLGDQAANGDKQALDALENLNDFIKRKSIKVGDAVFVNKYVGLDFEEFSKGISNELSLLKSDEVIGLVIDEEEKTDARE